MTTTAAPSNETANWDDPTEDEVRSTNGAFVAALGGPDQLTPLQVVSIAAITHSMTGYGFDLRTLPATSPAHQPTRGRVEDSGSRRLPAIRLRG